MIRITVTLDEVGGLFTSNIFLRRRLRRLLFSVVYHLLRTASETSRLLKSRWNDITDNMHNMLIVRTLYFSGVAFGDVSPGTFLSRSQYGWELTNAQMWWLLRSTGKCCIGFRSPLLNRVTDEERIIMSAAIMLWIAAGWDSDNRFLSRKFFSVAYWKPLQFVLCERQATGNKIPVKLAWH